MENSTETTAPIKNNTFQELKDTAKESFKMLATTTALAGAGVYAIIAYPAATLDIASTYGAFVETTLLGSGAILASTAITSAALSAYKTLKQYMTSKKRTKELNEIQKGNQKSKSLSNEDKNQYLAKIRDTASKIKSSNTIKKLGVTIGAMGAMGGIGTFMYGFVAASAPLSSVAMAAQVNASLLTMVAPAVAGAAVYSVGAITNALSNMKKRETIYELQHDINKASVKVIENESVNNTIENTKEPELVITEEMIKDVETSLNHETQPLTITEHPAFEDVTIEKIPEKQIPEVVKTPEETPVFSEKTSDFMVLAKSLNAGEKPTEVLVATPEKTETPKAITEEKQEILQSGAANTGEEKTFTMEDVQKIIAATVDATVKNMNDKKQTEEKVSHTPVKPKAKRKFILPAPRKGR